jgi:hypothetical protein
MNNKSMNRREFLLMGAVTLGTGAVFASCKWGGAKTPTTLPLLHVTDLFHPHGDPDDHFDLAVTYALARRGYFDLRGVVVDYPPEFRAGDPAVVAVAQMNRLAGFSVPVSIGTSLHLKNRRDTLVDATVQETAAVRFICSQLRAWPYPVALVCVGNAADIAVAALREPGLFKEKCAGVYLNSGSAHDNPEKAGMLEFNVRLDPAAYAAMFELPCPLYWYPCWNTVELRESGADGSFYWLQHRETLSELSSGAASYVGYMFGKAADPKWLRSMENPPADAETWEKILDGKRGMWSTASQFAAAGLTVIKDGTIVPAAKAGGDALFEMTPVEVTCADDGRLTWKRVDKPTGRWMMRVTDVARYPSAMTKAVATLFKEL